MEEVTTKSDVAILVDPRAYEIDKSRALQIQESFQFFIDEIDKLKYQLSQITVKDINDTESMELANRIRLSLVKVRTGTDKKHEQLKAAVIREGRFYDAFKNQIYYLVAPVEEEAKEKAETQKREFQRIKDERREERLKKLAAVNGSAVGLDLENMPDEVFDNVLSDATELFEFKEKQRKEKEQKDIDDALELKRQKEEKELERTRLKELSEEGLIYSGGDLGKIGLEQYAELKNSLLSEQIVTMQKEKIKAERLQKIMPYISVLKLDISKISDYSDDEFTLLLSEGIELEKAQVEILQKRSDRKAALSQYKDFLPQNLKDVLEYTDDEFSDLIIECQKKYFKFAEDGRRLETLQQLGVGYNFQTKYCVYKGQTIITEFDILESKDFPSDLEKIKKDIKVVDAKEEEKSAKRIAESNKSKMVDRLNEISFLSKKPLSANGKILDLYEKYVTEIEQVKEKYFSLLK